MRVGEGECVERREAPPLQCPNPKRRLGALKRLRAPPLPRTRVAHALRLVRQAIQDAAESLRHGGGGGDEQAGVEACTHGQAAATPQRPLLAPHACFAALAAPASLPAAEGIKLPSHTHMHTHTHTGMQCHASCRACLLQVLAEGVGHAGGQVAEERKVALAHGCTHIGGWG